MSKTVQNAKKKKQSTHIPQGGENRIPHFEIKFTKLLQEKIFQY